MIADFSPDGPISSQQDADNHRLRFHRDPGTDPLAVFFGGLSKQDRQILALHFAEQLNAYEIHVILRMPLGEVLCRIQRLRRLAQQSLCHAPEQNL
ncbi:MAG: hypothetical protein QGH76_01030 [Phycisphaerales bacterium]|jgi:DNA-directed RNA polymerase specialized sigma24 family protein|nr:hypothetical protein [Phycisphaerales bacterium]